jgi:hypothetical protein
MLMACELEGGGGGQQRQRAPFTADPAHMFFAQCFVGLDAFQGMSNGGGGGGGGGNVGDGNSSSDDGVL